MRTASHSGAWIFSWDCPKAKLSRVISATLPRQANCRESALRLVRQSPQLPQHEIHHIVGIALGANRVEVPDPGRGPSVEPEQPLLRQRAEKLDRKEWIAAGLLMDKEGRARREGRVIGRAASQGAQRLERRYPRWRPSIPRSRAPTGSRRFSQCTDPSPSLGRKEDPGAARK